ncbi:hypothetical protein CEXT_65701 [Caerostris extrusa]|uniref:Uncharacterized protein n=1 Tax=Caerostris extrusa TaxID=172846 RepID=A0AAV4QYK7_CAEEX|nr:hypothetical protein CEXT_65701 [Caerostris extrusa]
MNSDNLYPPTMGHYNFKQTSKKTFRRLIDDRLVRLIPTNGGKQWNYDRETFLASYLQKEKLEFTGLFEKISPKPKIRNLMKEEYLDSYRV